MTREDRPSRWPTITERALRRVAPWPDPSDPPKAVVEALAGTAKSVRR